MHRSIALLAVCLSIAGCTNNLMQVKAQTYASPIDPSLVGPLDVLEFRYLHRPLETRAPYKIGVGDRLSVNVFDHPELTVPEVLVLPDGYIGLPLIPRLRAFDNTIADLTDTIVRQYRARKIRDPEVTVTVLASGTRLQTFLQSIYQAGGQGGLRVMVDADGTLSPPALDPIPANRPLSEIRKQVQAAYINAFGPDLAVVVRSVRRDKPAMVHVMGEVTNPGSVEVDPNASVNAFGAIARAGGFLRTAKKAKVRVYRFTPETGVSQWEVNLSKPLEDMQSLAVNLQLQPDDVVYVPKTGIALANDAIEQYIRRMLPTQFGVGYDLNQ